MLAIYQASSRKLKVLETNINFFLIFCYTLLYECSQTDRGLFSVTGRRHRVVVVRFIYDSRIGTMVPPTRLATRIIARVLA